MAEFTGTPVSSPAYAAQVSELEKANAYNITAEMRMACSRVYTHSAGAGTGEVNLVKLPAGRIRIYRDLSRVITSQFAANADLHIGYRSYTKHDLTTAVEDNNAFMDNGDVGGAAIDSAFPLPTLGSIDLDSLDGVTIFAMIDTGNIEDGDTIVVYVAYSTY